MDYVRDFVSGFSGGCLSTAICHPFDLVRNRQAVQDGNRNRPAYSNQISIIKSVIRNDGVKALWRGVTPSIIGAGLSWGLYFPFYNFITDQLKKSQNNNVPSYQVIYDFNCISVLDLINGQLSFGWPVHLCHLKKIFWPCIAFLVTSPYLKSL